MTSPLNANLPPNLPPIGPRRVVYLEANRPPTALDTKYRDGSFYEFDTEWRDKSTTPPNIYKLANILSKTNAVWVLVTGGSGTIINIDVDAATAPGVDPVSPTGAGLLTITGAQVATGTTANVIRTHTVALNQFNIEIQRSTAAAATNVTLNGVSHFNSAQFTVDANGFVSLAGGGLAIDSINVDAHTAPGTDPVVPDGAGMITVTGAQVASGIVGANVIRTDSLAANTYTIEIQQTDAVAAKDTTKNGVAHFNSAQFTDDEGFISLIAAGPPTMSFNVDANTPPGTDPVVPTAGGAVTITGGQVAAGTVGANVIRTDSLAANTYTIEIQRSTTNAITDSTKNGVSHYDSTYFSVDANGFVTPTSALTTDLHAARYIVSAGGTADGANYTTIASAITAAAGAGAPQTIVVQPGTYTENLTLANGIDIAAYPGNGSTPSVTIVGKLSASFAGSCTISGIRLQTNSDYFLEVSGASATNVTLEQCYLNCTNNTGINYTSSSASSNLRIRRCNGDLGTTGITLLTHSSAGSASISYTRVLNSGGSSTDSTVSAGALYIQYSYFDFGFTTSGTSIFASTDNTFSPAGASLNHTALTAGGSGVHGSAFDTFSSGSASAISIGASCSLALTNVSVSSSNTNAITGAGTVIYTGVNFDNTSSTINTTTQTLRVTNGGEYHGRTSNTAPSAGMIGEQLTGQLALASATSLSDATAKTITSVSLTPGIWDVSCVGALRGNLTGTQLQVSISATNNTLATNYGVDNVSCPTMSTTASDMNLAIPKLRISLSATTTYYLVMQVNYTVGTATGYGYIAATRVA